MAKCEHCGNQIARKEIIIRGDWGEVICRKCFQWGRGDKESINRYWKAIIDADNETVEIVCTDKNEPCDKFVKSILDREVYYCKPCWVAAVRRRNDDARIKAIDAMAQIQMARELSRELCGHVGPTLSADQFVDLVNRLLPPLGFYIEDEAKKFFATEEGEKVKHKLGGIIPV